MMSNRMLFLFIAFIAVFHECMQVGVSTSEFRLTVSSKRRWYWVFSKYNKLRVEKTDGSWSFDLKKGDYYYHLFANGNGKGNDGEVHSVNENDDGTYSLKIEDWFPKKGGVAYVYKEIPISGDGGLEELFNGCAVQFTRKAWKDDNWFFLNCNGDGQELQWGASAAYWKSKENSAAFTMDDGDLEQLVTQITWPVAVLCLVGVCVLCGGCVGFCVHRRKRKKSMEIEIEFDMDRYENLSELNQEDLQI
mmetsp:Transcript_29879/g.48668  ORF Transcript_29879/g.48668 Transcript_29879/m.48668 type:complete len:248 (+) Transcript_29879:30-773(+)